MQGSNYPKDSDLKKLKNYDFSKNSLEHFLAFLEEIYNETYGCFVLTGKKIKKLRLVTGGWSGNEDVIDALHSNHVLWMISWQRSQVGGAYWFRFHPASFSQPQPSELVKRQI